MFECLTGSPPFMSADPGRLIRMHATEVAPRVRVLSPELPPSIEAVVAKLLAKDPDDRYASALGLARDLARFDTLTGDPTELETQKLEGPDSAADTLFGRSEELDVLLGAASVARAGNGCLVSVSGPTGMGATQLVRTWMNRERTSQEAVCLWVACASESATPLGALRSALSESVHGADRVRLGPLLREAAGDYGACLAAQFPALASLFGTSRLGEGIPVSQEVGYEAVCSLLLSVAQSVGLLLLVFDDADQMDSATRSVLERLLPRVARAPIAVVCTSKS